MTYSLTYTIAAGRQMVRDALGLDEARREARRIAKRIGGAVKVWSEGGRLVATIAA